MSTATLEAPPAVKWPTDRLVTGEELLNHPEWGNCELIRGKAVSYTHLTLPTNREV